ncbi:MAG: FkbM family methyltransferase [Rhodospirillaceae bacterium]
MVRSGADVPAEKILPFGFFELDMFECPPFVMFSSGDVPVLTYIFDEGTFEPCSMRLWCRLAKSATGFLDIGANVGIYSLAAAKLRPDLLVHAFEPNPYAYARLRVHKHVNNLPNLVEHCVGVHLKSGLAVFTWLVKPHGNVSSGACPFLEPGEGRESAAVRLERIDGSGLAATLGVRPLVKVDVEGAEALVFDAMKEVLALRPDIIVETFDQNACDAINAHLLPLGYDVYSIHEKDGFLRRKERLTPCDVFDPHHDFNQFLTCRPRTEIQGAMNVA